MQQRSLAAAPQPQPTPQFLQEALKATIEAPWINTGPDFETAGRAQFAEILKTGLTGARLNLPEEHPNIYMAFGSVRPLHTTQLFRRLFFVS